MIRFDKEQVSRVIAEAEKTGGRVILACPKHKYVASLIPPSTSGCSDCWFFYFFYCVAMSGPDSASIKEERDFLESSVMHQVELAKAGKYDFVPYARPEVKIERDVEDN